eukprot:TRINITY_DN11494_c0_g3_i3.p1 TRINITY_DN11494_c0_g3~~TRINITY_DN11494_c0_g3_i3.p1  ORF type:complete len:290 (-),score=55.59 TRINITY_DN11494_c0_g3_i3:1533-2402(-)
MMQDREIIGEKVLQDLYLYLCKDTPEKKIPCQDKYDLQDINDFFTYIATRLDFDQSFYTSRKPLRRIGGSKEDKEGKRDRGLATKIVENDKSNHSAKYVISKSSSYVQITEREKFKPTVSSCIRRKNSEDSGSSSSSCGNSGSNQSNQSNAESGSHSCSYSGTSCSPTKSENTISASQTVVHRFESKRRILAKSVNLGKIDSEERNDHEKNQPQLQSQLHKVVVSGTNIKATTGTNAKLLRTKIDVQDIQSKITEAWKKPFCVCFSLLFFCSLSLLFWRDLRIGVRVWS